ncbi:hypothetical protein AA0Z93_14235 [Pseudomonas sp. 1P02AnB]
MPRINDTHRHSRALSHNPNVFITATTGSSRLPSAVSSYSTVTGRVANTVRLTSPASSTEQPDRGQAQWLTSYYKADIHFDGLQHLQAWYERLKARPAVCRALRAEGLA